jgi:hypothetical protein
MSGVFKNFFCKNPRHLELTLYIYTENAYIESIYTERILAVLEDKVVLGEWSGGVGPSFPGAEPSRINLLLFRLVRSTQLLPEQVVGNVTISPTSLAAVGPDGLIYEMGTSGGIGTPPTALWLGLGYCSPWMPCPADVPMGNPLEFISAVADRASAALLSRDSEVCTASGDHYAQLAWPLGGKPVGNIFEVVDSVIGLEISGIVAAAIFAIMMFKGGGIYYASIGMQATGVPDYRGLAMVTLSAFPLYLPVGRAASIASVAAGTREATLSNTGGNIFRFRGFLQMSGVFCECRGYFKFLKTYYSDVGGIGQMSGVFIKCRGYLKFFSAKTPDIWN